MYIYIKGCRPDFAKSFVDKEIKNKVTNCTLLTSACQAKASLTFAISKIDNNSRYIIWCNYVQVNVSFTNVKTMVALIMPPDLLVCVIYENNV